MSEGDKTRLIAWNRELRAAHERLRAALRIAAGSPGADSGAKSRDLLLYCHGFCAALGGHHAGEDGVLFPELSARHPELRPVIERLGQDHQMIAALLGELDEALGSRAPAAELAARLRGLSAIMESHFRYEERKLLGILAQLELDADPRAVLGPL